MRFNINRPLNCTWVDDVPVQDLDTSALPENVLRVKWLDQEGYVYYTDSTLNTKIADPSPYQVHINNWMTASIPGTPEAPPLTLAEAKQIKIYFIEAVFNTKRQAPYAYPVASGSAFTWDASDSSVAAMSGMMVPVLSSMIGGLASEGGETQNSLVAQINNRLAFINSNFTAITVSLTSGVVNVGNALVTYINDTIVWAINTGVVMVGGNQPPAGILSPVDETTLVFVPPTATAPIPPIDGSSVAPPGMTLQWTPIGMNAPVAITVAEMSGMMAGIAARRSNLLSTKSNKIIAVDSLTTITGVIAYDATAGW